MINKYLIVFEGENMKENISKVFEKNEGIPLFYVEGGSRLWGIDGKDSDYDVRGIHLQPKKNYFDFKTYRDVIEIMNGDFDFVSYDIDKMFSLLLKSNPTVFEWIRAHLIYFNILPEFELFKKNIMDNFSFKSLYYHYLSMSKGHIHLIENNKNFNYKTVFYAIRGLLSAKLAAKKIIPELLILNLFEQFEKEDELIILAKNSIDKKRESKEKNEVESDKKEYILNVLKQSVKHISETEIKDDFNENKLYKVLYDYSFMLKNEYYK